MKSKMQEGIIAEAACISEQIEDIALCATMTIIVYHILSGIASAI